MVGSGSAPGVRGQKALHAVLAAVLVVLTTVGLLSGCGEKKVKGPKGRPSLAKSTSPEKGQQSTETNLAWPSAYRDNRLTGRSPYPGPGTGEVKWTCDLDSGTKTWAVLGSDGPVIAGSQSRVVGLDPSTGQVAWEFSTGAQVAKWCRVADDGTVYVGAGNTVYALSEKGASKWTFDMGSEADSPALASDGTVYAGSLGGRLVALSSQGQLKWEYKAAGSIRSPSIDDGGNLYCGAAPLVLYALDKNGQKKWEFKPEGDLSLYEGMFPWINCMQSPSIGDDGTLYTGSQVSPGITSTGQQIPDYSMPDKGKLYAVTPDGQKKWDYASGSYATMTPTIGTDGTLYAGTSICQVVALNADGSIKWVFNSGETSTCPFIFSPSIGKDGLLYAATSSAKMFCLSPDGSEKWRYAAETTNISTGSNNMTPPALAPDGTLFSTLYQGKVLAFRK